MTEMGTDMDSCQLSCGCWVTPGEPREIGAPLACRRCDTMRTVVIGWARWSPPDPGRGAQWGNGQQEKA